jgi:hypothetical protein
LALCFSALSACTPPAPRNHFQETIRLVESKRDRFPVKWGRTREALIVPASSEALTRVVYASYGVVMPTVPLRHDAILESAPVAVGDQRVIYRMRYSVERPKHIILDAVAFGGSGSVVIQPTVAGFGREAWIPIEAVEKRLMPPGERAPRREQWRPTGCPETAYTSSYCI